MWRVVDLTHVDDIWKQVVSTNIPRTLGMFVSQCFPFYFFRTSNFYSERPCQLQSSLLDTKFSILVYLFLKTYIGYWGANVENFENNNNYYYYYVNFVFILNWKLKCRIKLKRVL